MSEVINPVNKFSGKTESRINDILKDSEHKLNYQQIVSLKESLLDLLNNELPKTVVLNYSNFQKEKTNLIELIDYLIK
jgi:flagellar motor switch protein FliG